jgi:pimeloyl-ACP methyl ester carboxylesterase
MPSSLNHAFADVNGIRMHYASTGKGELVLFLHGFPEFWYEWRKQLAHFGRDHFAVAPDLRGYNLSSKPAKVDDYALPVLVEDIRALVAHLGYTKFTLVGHDWGGALGWVFAIKHPEMLRQLVTINAPHPAIFRRELLENPAQQKASQYMLVFRSPIAEDMLSASEFSMLERAVLAECLQKGHLTEADRKAYIEAWSIPGALTGGLNYYRAARIGPPDGVTVMPPAPDPATIMVNVPTCVIWGEQDTALLTGNLNGLEKLVPRLRVERVPDATHWIVHEKPELLNRLIRDFMNEA